MVGSLVFLLFFQIINGIGENCFRPGSTNGTVTFLEDCSTIQLLDLPWVVYPWQKLGIHPVVCCPRKADVENGKIKCYDCDNKDKYAERIQSGQDKTCQEFISLPEGGNLTECVTSNRCRKLLDTPDDGISALQTCGFDDSTKSMMICCPNVYVSDSTEHAQQTPRFPLASGKARQCEDKHHLCLDWKEKGACKLDGDKDMFEFMQGACMETCGWCGDKGCVDEDPRCQIFARKGWCAKLPDIMVHMCRESCGVCGFLSVDNTEEQTAGGRSYTDFTRDDFECGRYNRLCEVNGEECEMKEDEESLQIKNEDKLEDISTLEEDHAYVNLDVANNLDAADLFFSTDPDSNTTGEYFCGAVMISDRWYLTAAHCYHNQSKESGYISVNTIRDNTIYKEIIEVKRVYLNPLYEYPKMYNDIALVELGRRVVYNFTKYGDSPTCMDPGMSDTVLEGLKATVQGYGINEDGTRGDLLEAKVQIISKQLCKEYLIYNTSHIEEIKQKLSRAFPFGLDYGLLCNHGFLNDEGITSGSCDGDSGGPLTVVNEAGRQTLAGIISGGVGCGSGVPSWNTQVSFFTDWIRCIVQGRLAGDGPAYVKEKCKDTVKKPPKCEELKATDLIFEDMSSQTECENYEKKKQQDEQEGDLYF